MSNLWYNTVSKNALRDALTSEGSSLTGVDHVDTVSKICCGCKTSLPLSEFYKRKGTNSYTSECKGCMKLRSKNALPLDPQEPRAATEVLAVEYLHRNGIPALPGKAMSYKHVDIVAFGCVLIEVKYSTLEYARGIQQFRFNTTPSQQKNGFSADLVLLVCDYGNKLTFHLFDSKAPVFYMGNRVKTGFTFTPGALEAKKHGENRVVMTQPLMDAAQNQVRLVHKKLKIYCDNLKSNKE